MSQSAADRKKVARARVKAVAARQEKGPSPRQKLENDLGDVQKALFNMRQMYDQKVMEIDAFRQQIGQRDQLIAGIVLEYGPTVSLEQTTLQYVASADIQGYEINTKDGEIKITLVEAEVDQDAGTQLEIGDEEGELDEA